MLTQDRLKELLDYDPLTGVFVWKKKISYKIVIGKVAGSNARGYLEIGIYGKSYRAHRLAWLYVYGVRPLNDIDHINHNKTDNRISNLRDVTHAENLQNQTKAYTNSKSRFIGVYCRRGKYCAQIRISGKKKYLGDFATPEEAYATYLIAKRIHHATCMI